MVQSKLDHLRKIVRTMNLGTTSLDHILCMGAISKAREGIGYQKESLDSKIVVQKKNSHIKSAKIEELVRTLPRTKTYCSNKKDKFLKKEDKEVRCYYCPKMGHIRHRYRHYKSNQKRRLKENLLVEKPTWVEKGKGKAEIKKGGTLIIEAHGI